MKFVSKRDWWISVLMLVIATYYVLSEDFLILRCGPLKVKIPYKNIDSIKATKNMISSIALSTDKFKL